MLGRSHGWKYLSNRSRNKRMGPTVLANKGSISNFSSLDQKTGLSMDSATMPLEYSGISVNGGVTISLNNGNRAKTTLSSETKDVASIPQSSKGTPYDRFDSTVSGFFDNTPFSTPFSTPQVSKDLRYDVDVSNTIFERKWQCFGKSFNRSSSESPCDFLCPNDLNCDFLRVMTFNTLAQSLVDSKYVNNDAEIMNWTRRRQEILKVVRESCCDIICLQEVDAFDFHDFFAAEFKALGYSVIYKRKLQNRLDGIAVLYKPSRFKLLVQRDIGFSSEHEQYDKPQVAVILALEDLNSNVYIVSTTHLLFNKNRGDVKVYQLITLLNAINDLKIELRERNPAVLICGDFNLTPQSLLYSFLDRGLVVLKNSNPRNISGQYLMFNETYLTSSVGHSDAGTTVGDFKHYLDDIYCNEDQEEKEGGTEWYVELRKKHSRLFEGNGVVFDLPEGVDESSLVRDTLISPLSLKSAYNRDVDVEGIMTEPAYTAYHGWQKGCVDYIWYDPQQLTVEAIYEMPPYQHVHERGNLPNRSWPPSDHFSLISLFKRG